MNQTIGGHRQNGTTHCLLTCIIFMSLSFDLIFKTPYTPPSLTGEA
jgi:hypothetical protein